MVNISMLTTKTIRIVQNLEPAQIGWKRSMIGCEDTTEHTITEWLSCDTEANQLYADDEIISSVQNKPQDDSDLEETDEPDNALVSHSEAANALEISLQYI
ncbi:hypothetical protein AVEN_78957-1 [Araneus ventricosus]|uniref:DDE-1 domain-containing protein n=1 Tax=Araneus ventricosus TaxID=182803 RepID=A0A4Y2WB62_ARAVE|nr:hypothetical protein AVEN_78957-1 [Araneus ventricosus]